MQTSELLDVFGIAVGYWNASSGVICSGVAKAGTRILDGARPLDAGMITVR